VALMLAVQSAEVAEGEVELVQPLAALGEAAKLENENPSSSDLLSSLQGSDPNLSVEQTEEKPPASTNPADLEKQLGAMVDNKGQSPITGAIPDPAGTTEEKVADPNAEPALSPEAIAEEKTKAAKKAAALLAAGKVEFREIPSFVFKEDSKQEYEVSRDECEGQCRNDADCISYSYKQSTEECIKSKSCIQYDLEYVMYARKAQTVEGVAAFRMLGNLKYMEPNKEDQKVASFPGITDSACAATCGKEAKCVSYAYRSRDEMCLTSTQDLGYSEDWTYYEKAGASLLLAQKIKDKMVADEAIPKAAPASADDKTEDEKLKEVDRTSLSSSQLAALNAAKKGTEGNSDVRAVLLDGLKAKTAELTAEEAARAAVAKADQEKANAAAKVEEEFEIKGKEVYKSDITETKGALDKAVESAHKSGWKASESSAKSEELNRESTQKETAANQAAKLKSKTTDDLSSTATAILEAKDAASAVDDRKALFNSAHEHFKGLDNIEAAKIKVQANEIARATAQIVEAKNEEKLNEMKSKEKSKQAEVDSLASLINAKQGLISELNLKIPSMNTEKDAAEQENTAVESEVNRLQAEVNAEADATVKATKEQQLETEKTKESDAKTKVQQIVSEQSEIATKISQAQSFVSTKSSEKGSLEIALNTATSKVGTEQTRLQELLDSGNQLLASAKYKSNQALAAEFKVKTDLANKMKEQLAFAEGDTKKKLKLAELQDKLKELEESQASQVIESKIKTAIKYSKIAEQKQKKVDDVVAEAKADENRSIKMVADAKYAAATAVTVDQRVAAANQESEAEALKVSSEQKLATLTAPRQAAKEAAEQAEDKLNALKDHFKDDEGAFKKAMGIFENAKKQLPDQDTKSEVNAAEKQGKYDAQLTKEHDTMAGFDLNKKGNAPEGSNKEPAGQSKEQELREKMNIARQNSGVDQAGKADEEIKEKMSREDELQNDVKKESSTKQRIAEMTAQDTQVRKTEARENAKEKDAKEIRSKGGEATAARGGLSPAQAEEVQIHEQDAQAASAEAEAAAAKMNESTSKNRLALEQTEEKSTKSKITEKVTAEECAAAPNGQAFTLQEKEVCNKNKAAELLATEKTAKTNGKNEELQITVEEKKTKSDEGMNKEAGEKTDARSERGTKESATKENEQKSTQQHAHAAESRQKESQQEKVTKELSQKDQERQEGYQKSDAKLNQEERTKAGAARELGTKTQEKSMKQEEKDNKENFQKKEVDGKSSDENSQKMDENAQKSRASQAAEQTQEDALERGEKTRAQSNLEADRSEKAQKEQAVKNSNESTTKTASQNDANERQDKELAEKKKQSDQEASAAAEKTEKQTASLSSPLIRL